MPIPTEADPTHTSTRISDRADAIRSRITRAWEPSGNIEEVTKLVAGSIVVLVGIVAWTTRRRGIGFRKPNEHERTGVAEPIASILVRHFPMAALSTDWADSLTAIGATVAYVDNGPLLWIETPALQTPPFPEGNPDVP